MIIRKSWKEVNLLSGAKEADQDKYKRNRDHDDCKQGKVSFHCSWKAVFFYNQNDGKAEGYEYKCEYRTGIGHW